MSKQVTKLHRRGFLQTAGSAAGAALAPMFIPGSVLGKNGAVPPSERIVVGGIGIGNRGTYDLGCFLEQKDVQFVAVCDVKEARRDRRQEDGRRALRQSELRHVSRLSRAAGPQRHRRRADRHRPELARHGRHDCGQGRQGHVLRKALHQEHRSKPACWPRPSAAPAASSRPARSGATCRTSPSPASWPAPASSASSRRVYAHPAGMTRTTSGWLPAEPEPPKEEVDWDMYLGPAAWRPFNAKLLDGFNFEKGGGLVGGGVLEWGSHCVDLCQWAVGDDRWAPVEYNPPKDGQIVARYAERRRAGLPREGLASAGLVPRAVRRRDRLGRDGRQRQAGAQLARAAGRPQGRRNRRLPGDVPRPRFPRLREVARPAQGQRRRGLLRTHRLPRGQHRPLPRIGTSNTT